MVEPGFVIPMFMLLRPLIKVRNTVEGIFRG